MDALNNRGTSFRHASGNLWSRQEFSKQCVGRRGKWNVGNGRLQRNHTEKDEGDTQQHKSPTWGRPRKSN